MEHCKRRAIAYIVGRIISGKESGAVFDFKDSSYFNFMGDIGSSISVFDYSRSSYLTGDKSSIFDYNSGKYITLNIEGINFSGFDYESGKYYSGIVNSNSISFFDYDGSSYYNFSI
jgi:hypothetical protein